MPREDADEIVANLVHNSPRVVRAEKALAIIRDQARPDDTPEMDM